MKVVTVCSSRYHIFNQAQELLRHGVLHRLITAYPKWATRQWGFPDNAIVSLFSHGVLRFAVNRLPSHFPRSLKSRAFRHYFGSFAKRVSRNLPIGADIFIGLSGHSLPSLSVAKNRGMTALVDHGSLHERTERQLLMEESQRYGFQEHGNWSMNWLMEMEDKEFGDADGIIVASNAAKQSMIDNDVAEKKIFVNNLGVDCEVFTPGVKRDDVFRVVQCSSVTPRKGIHHLLRAFAELNLPESELWFIGGGLTGAARDKEFSGFIKRYARTNILFRGSVRQRDLIPIYQQASVAVLLSVADGFGMVVPQAMACGLPVIVSSKTGAADLVKPGHNGYVIPSGDIEMLKTHLLTLYEQPERRRSMGVLARQTIAEGFTWTHYGERLVRYLRSL